jgi:hypothetical protein|tara:strand:+ start:796 stop:933 length:138 start_codon:yes stop_codon:yes gene_type:complete
VGVQVNETIGEKAVKQNQQRKYYRAHVSIHECKIKNVKINKIVKK